MGGHEKKLHRLTGTLVFLDESGLLMAPLVRRTWAPCGETPILLQRTRSAEKVSAIAALTVSPYRRRVRLYVSLFANRNVRTAELLRFLRALRRHVRGPLVLVWDRLNVHRAGRLQVWLAAHGVTSVFLPPYAPELNPVELWWAYLKHHRLANFAAQTARQLARVARRQTRAVARCPLLLRGFIQGTPLSSCLD